MTGNPSNRTAPATACAMALTAALTLAAAFVTLRPAPAAAIVPPAKPLDQLAEEVTAFLVSDVGIGGIRVDELGNPVPPYFYHYAIRDSNRLWSCGSGYPGYCSVSYPAYTISVAIDAFLDMRRWSGDPALLARARQCADWLLAHRTPAGDLYGNLPYSTQTDGVMGGGWDGPAIMTDKPAMFGLRLLRLYDITGEPAYWQGALEIAATLAATQRRGAPEVDGSWPFRVVPADGTVTQDYTSHLQPAVRFFDALAGRTGDPTYAEVRDRALAWLLNNPCAPASPSYQRWEAFYEDQSPEMQTGLRDHYSAHEMIVELVRRRPAGWAQTAAAILDSATARYVSEGAGSRYAPYEPVTLEWEGWPEATYAASLQYARTALLLHAALAGDPLQDPAWRERALRMIDACTHGQNDRDLSADGRMFTTVRDLLYVFNVDSWYEQNFNTVLYALEIMALEPELAPADETHLLSAETALTAIEYGAGFWALSYATAGGAGRETARLPAPPGEVRAGGVALPQLAAPGDPGPGWHWDGARQLLTVVHAQSPVQVRLETTAVPGGAPPPALALAAPAPNPFNPRTTIAFSLREAGEVRLAVHAPDGRLVRVLLARPLPAGRHEATWDGTDAAGRRLAAGTYLLRLESGGRTATAKLTLLK